MIPSCDLRAGDRVRIVDASGGCYTLTGAGDSSRVRSASTMRGRAVGGGAVGGGTGEDGSALRHFRPITTSLLVLNMGTAGNHCNLSTGSRLFIIFISGPLVGMEGRGARALVGCLWTLVGSLRTLVGGLRALVGGKAWGVSLGLLVLD